MSDVKGAIHPLFVKLGPVDVNDSADIDRFLDRLFDHIEDRFSDDDGMWWISKRLDTIRDELKGKQ